MRPIWNSAAPARSHSQKATDPIQRVYAVGDIHGRYDLFRQLMNIIEQDRASRPAVATQIVLLGDIVDRGPDAARMVRGCINLTASTDRFLVLKGNHEEMMSEALKGDLYVYGHWLTFGGRETLLSWGVDRQVAEGPATMDNLAIAADTVGHEVISWMEQLPLHYQHGNHFFVHAGIRPGISLRKQHPNDLLWIKDEFLESSASHGPIIVHGHTIVEGGPVVRSNRIGIDTGAYRSGRLTALAIEGEDSWYLNTPDVLQPTDGQALPEARVAHVTSMSMPPVEARA
jgi:serine/threonine protein phosphatase 1